MSNNTVSGGCRSFLPLFALAFAGATLSAAGEPPSKPTSDAEPPIALEEETHDAPAPREATARQATSPAARITRGAFTSIQVNIDAGGNDVLFDAANEPSIAVDPTAPNRLAVGWRQFDNIVSNFRQAGYSYSRDGGRTWAPMQVIEPGLFRSDPVLRAGPDGTFYYLSLGTATGSILADIFVSTDGGATWPTKAFAFGGDKQWFAIDATGGLGHGHLYQGWNTAGNNYFPAQFNRSTNGGTTWEPPVEYTPGSPAPVRPVFGVLDVGPDGAVYVVGTDAANGYDSFALVRSSNAQDAMVTPIFEQVTPLDFGGAFYFGTGPNPAGLVGQAYVAVDRSGGPHDGNVYVLNSVDPPGTDPLDVMFLRSTDGGASFGPPVRINDDDPGVNAWSWFGTMSVAPNGRIDVVFNDTRTEFVDRDSELYYSYSMDGGVTFSPNTVMTPVWDSHDGWPNQDKIGDYYDMVSDNVGAHLIYAATYTGGQDVYYLRIGDYDCNGNGIGDADDLAAMTSPDCDGNGIPDECEIAAGAAADDDVDGVLDRCELAIGDTNLDGVVDIFDLLNLLRDWGPCPAPPAACPADTNGDGSVDILDLLTLLANWG